MGPLIDEGAVRSHDARVSTRFGSRAAKCLTGGKRLRGCFVEPALVKAQPRMPILKEEIFAPILYLIEFDNLDEAIAWHNDVPQGLSSAIFTNSVSRVGDISERARQRLRHRQREHRHQRRGDRRRVRRRKRHRRRPRIGQRRLEGLHAAADGDRQLVGRIAAGPGYSSSTPANLRNQFRPLDSRI